MLGFPSVGWRRAKGGTMLTPSVAVSGKGKGEERARTCRGRREELSHPHPLAPVWLLQAGQTLT